MVETVENEQCQVCETYEIFNKLVASGIESDFAFHVAVTQLVVGVVEEAIEEAYDTGYNEGYKVATSDVAEIVKAYADSVEDED